jgi:hypothetical protein
MSSLPGILGQIAEVAGEQAARRIAAELGGQRVSFARRPGPENAVARIVGIDAARAIADHIGWGEMVIPLGPATRTARIRAMLAQGVSHNRIAAAVQVHIRTVERIASRMRTEDDDRQPDLFG